MTTARRDKHIQHRSTEEGQQRIGSSIGNGDAGIAEDGAERDAAGTYASDNAHDARIEGELKDDACRALGGGGESTDIGQWGAMKQDSKKKEEHDDTAEVE